MKKTRTIANSVLLFSFLFCISIPLKSLSSFDLSLINSSKVEALLCSDDGAMEERCIDILDTKLSPATISIAQLTISCSDNNDGTFAATIAAEVEWNTPPAGEDILVQLNGASQTISVSTGASSPQTINFNLPFSDDCTVYPYEVTANFSTTTSCGDTTAIVSLSPCPNTNTCTGASDELGGNVYQDSNLDGIDNDSGGGLEGMKVYIYGCDVNGSSVVVDSTFTDSNGDYHFTGLTNGEAYRIEFVFPCYYDYLAAAFNGSGSNTSVQFATAPSCTINLGVANPVNYCETNPGLIAPCFISGDPLGGGTSANSDILASFRYSSEGGPTVSPYTGAPYHPVPAVNTGTVWGLAYQRSSETLFTTAMLKRHAGLGTLGTGGIYKITGDLLSNATTTTPFIDLNTIISGTTGTDPRTISNDLPADGGASYDSLALGLVGKIALGDIDISDDEQTLWVVNLADRTLYSIFVGNPAQVPTSGDVTAYPIPNPNCSNGDYRPWAVKCHQGKIYIGVVCSAETSQNAADLHATVYVLDANTGNFANVFDFPLDYTRHDNWEPWTSTFTWVQNYTRHPQAILSDIEFDEDGSMILGFMDRLGHQTGYLNYSEDPTDTNRYNGESEGDIIRVYFSNGAFELENNGTTSNSPVGKLGPNNNQGPGGGEFYWWDMAAPTGDPNGGAVFEITVGGLALLPGTGEVVVSAADLFRGNSGGIAFLDNTSGGAGKRYEIFYSVDAPNTFGKAGGIGDVELLCEAPPIEIGNYVWNDSNNDGIQDACETPLSGIEVSLFDNSGTILAAVTTDANGQYYFSSTTPGIDTILANTNYYIVVGTGGQFVNGFIQDSLALTVDNTGMGAYSDLNDSDGTIATGLGLGFDGLPYVELTTGSSGHSDHKVDFGFSAFCTPPTVGITVNPPSPTCAGETISLAGSGTGTPYWTGPNGFTSSSLLLNLTNTTVAQTGDYQLLVDNNGCQDSMTVSIVVSPAPTADAGTDVEMCGTGGVQLNASGGSTYLWSPTTGLSNPAISNPLANPSNTTLYNVTVSNAAGCEANDQVRITVGASEICHPVSVTKNTN